MKQIVIILIPFLTSITSSSIGQNYQNKDRDKKNNQSTADTPFVPSDPNQFYFPVEVFSDISVRTGIDSFKDTWYSQQLFALREPIIFSEKSKNEIYRFTWLRSFHNPIAIRIEKDNDKYFLFWKTSDGKGGHSPGKLVVNKQISIDKARWDEFKKLLNQIDFWNLQTNNKDFGDDGAQWILEGKTNKKYHVVDRWTPKKESDFYQCCNMLIELTDLNIKSEDKY